MKLISVFDGSAKSDQNKVRGVGRYLATLQDAFSDTEEISFQFTGNLKDVKKDSVFLNPFLNPIAMPVRVRRVTQKQIAVIHDLVPLKYPTYFPLGWRGFFYKLANRWALKSYDHIVTDSTASKNDIVRYYTIPEKRVHVIYPTVSQIFTPHLDTAEESETHHHPFHKKDEQSVPEFTDVSNLSLDAIPALSNIKDFVLYVGDATWNKNLPMLATSVKMLGIPCVCVGKVFEPKQNDASQSRPHPWHRWLAQFQAMTKNDPNFIFPGYVPDGLLLQLYRKARVNLLLSQDEGFGLSYIEASSVGTPSVLSDIPVFHEIARDAALFADPNNAKEIASHISNLFYDTMLHEKMSIKAFDRAQDFHPGVFKEAWMKLLANM